MSSSSSSSSSSSTTPDSGPAGLGSMSSLSPTCTPLKHRYDACFNAWFQDYLGAGSPSAQQPAAQMEPAKPAARRRMGFFGGGGGGDDAAPAAGVSIGGGGGGDQQAQREAKRNDLEEKCGAFFREYQACVKRALREKDLLPLLSQAREYNPFPFPAQSSGGKAAPPDGAKNNNSPFPFAAASKEERMEWEKREGW